MLRRCRHFTWCVLRDRAAAASGAGRESPEPGLGAPAKPLSMLLAAVPRRARSNRAAVAAARARKVTPVLNPEIKA